jgi:hypothetical protein
VTSFFEKYGGNDNEDNLVILYHTGHGTFDDNLKHLELHGYASLIVIQFRAYSYRREWEEGKPAPPKVIWNHTERKFIDVARCDVLTIMDSCFAGGVSSVVEKKYGRTYEYLGASKANTTTQAPGPKSFTRALISSLKQLLRDRKGQAFTIHDLQIILSEQQYRRGNKGVLFPRSENNSRRIELRPIKRETTYFDDSKIHAYLNLRIELKQSELSNEELDQLAKLVSRAVRDSEAQTRRVDLLSLEQRTPPSWQKAVQSVNTMRNGLNAFGVQNTLSKVAEKEARNVRMNRPGLYAVVGWMSPRLHPHSLTILLQRPWSIIFLGGVFSLMAVRLVTAPGIFKRLFGGAGSWFGVRSNVT